MPQKDDCEHSKFKLCFTLKQHTPMIHFQSDQIGATLRATELKPKLDRFLIEVFEDKKENYEKFLISKGKNALDYTIKIVDKNSKENEIKNKTYFGNMGKKNTDKEFRHTIVSDKIQIIFQSFNSKILELIKNNFASFLVTNNFGTRQSKGFGGYYIDKSDLNYKEPIEALNRIDSKYIYANYNDSTSTIFSHVEVIYPLMKTGINFPDYLKKEITLRDGKKKKVPDPSQGRGVKASYYKSYLFQYMLNQNKPIGNEKRYIKENFFKEELQIESDGSEKKYVRAMLGLSDGIEFKDHERKGKIEYSSSVDRFKSPLIFKIIDKTLYIIANEIPKKMYNLEFTFKDKELSKTINTPQDFDLVDFLYSFSDYFNNELKVNKSENKQNLFDKKILQAQVATFLKVSS